MNLTPNDKLKLEGALKDMSTSMTRVEAERDLQKNVIGDICEPCPYGDGRAAEKIKKILDAEEL